MSSDNLAEMDFERARFKAFWRRVISWITGESNNLLPFDEVREKLPIKGQYYAGLKQVPINQIIGSTGRYRDFDRAFLPLQTHTRSRWVSIDRAHYQEIILPPVELYKIGEIYFVKDGNHRVSVARERGQEFVDAIVTEIATPFNITQETDLSGLALQRERLYFFEQTELDQLRPDNGIQASIEGQYNELLEHIAVHRWYLGEQKQHEVSYRDAVLSWYDTVYKPLVEMLGDYDLLEAYSSLTETDFYFLIIKYAYFLRQAFKEDTATEKVVEPERESTIKEEAVKQAVEEAPLPEFRKLASVLRTADWLDDLLLGQERATFFHLTGINELFPDINLETSIPGQYEKLLEHINVHRYYLGEQTGSEIPHDEAVKSWYINVYLPLVRIIREQDILANFPGRTETDLYLWITSHQWYLRESLGTDVPIEQAAEQLSASHGGKKNKKSRKNSKKKKK